MSRHRLIRLFATNYEVMSVSQNQTLLTKQNAAELLGLSTRQIDRYIEKGMPREGSGRKARFGPAAFEWHRQYEARQNQAGKEAGSLTEEQARKTKIDADRAELKLRKEQGLLIPADLVQQAQEQINSNIRGRLLMLPSKMAARIHGIEDMATIQTLLYDEVWTALDELSRTKW